MVIIDAYSYENDDEDIWCTAGYPDYRAYIFSGSIKLVVFYLRDYFEITK